MFLTISNPRKTLKDINIPDFFEKYIRWTRKIEENTDNLYRMYMRNTKKQRKIWQKKRMTPIPHHSFQQGIFLGAFENVIWN